MNMIKEADTQTSLTGKVWNVGEQLFNSSILDQFINSHEQSYEEFLNSFTYLSKEEEGKKTQGGKVGSFRKTFLPSELSARNEQDGSPGRSKEIWESLPAEPKEKETVMNESWKAAGSGGDYLSLPEGVEQVAKCGDVEDAHVCEGTCSGHLIWLSVSSSLPRRQHSLHSLLPQAASVQEEAGLAPKESTVLINDREVEQTVTYCTPFFEKPIQQKLRTMSVPQPAGSKAQELLGDDVQPFSLDEEFDYDNVALTPKFSEAELKAILELSEEKKTKTDVKSA